MKEKRVHWKKKGGKLSIAAVACPLCDTGHEGTGFPLTLSALSLTSSLLSATCFSLHPPNSNVKQLQLSHGHYQLPRLFPSAHTRILFVLCKHIQTTQLHSPYILTNGHYFSLRCRQLARTEPTNLFWRKQAPGKETPDPGLRYVHPSFHHCTVHNVTVSRPVVRRLPLKEA